MIDTVKLLIPREKVTLNDRAFPEGKNNEDFLLSFKNISTLKKKSGLHYPRICNYKSLYGKSANVKLEFSVSKLIFQNNFDECTDEDFDLVVQTLHKRLFELGLYVNPEFIENALVCNIHYSKNIILEHGYTSNYIISELSKIDARKNLDLASVKYMNDGKSIYLTSSTYQFTIYDKASEMNKKTNEEVLRLEVRLLKSKKIKDTLRKLELEMTPTLKNLFSYEISKAVVNNYWDTLVSTKNASLFLIEKGPADILRHIYFFYPKITLNKALSLLSCHLLSTTGMRELRSLAEHKVDTRTWYRLKKDLVELQKRLSDYMGREWILYVSEEIKNYKLINKL
jgi:hypothetical protein